MRHPSATRTVEIRDKGYCLLLRGESYLLLVLRDISTLRSVALCCASAMLAFNFHPYFAEQELA